MKSEKMRQNKFINIDRYLYTYIIISYIFWPIFLLMGFYLFNFNSSEIYFFWEGLDEVSHILLIIFAPATTFILFANEAIFLIGIVLMGEYYRFIPIKVISATFISWFLSYLIYYGATNWLLRKIVSEYYLDKINDISGEVSHLIHDINENFLPKTTVFMFGVSFLALYLSQKQIPMGKNIQIIYYTSFFLLGICAVRFNKSFFTQLKWCVYWILFWTIIYLICIHLFWEQQQVTIRLNTQESISVLKSSFLSFIISYLYLLSSWKILKWVSKDVFLQNIIYSFHITAFAFFSWLVVFLPGRIFSDIRPGFDKWLRGIGGWIHSHYFKIIFILIVGGGFIAYLCSLLQKKREWAES